MLERWDRDADDHRRLLDMTVGYVPAFEEVRARSFSRLRTLRSEESIYLKAIEDLKTTTRDKLQKDHAEDLAAVFKDFEERYPAISGMNNLQEDLEHYLAIRQAMLAKDMPKVLRMLNATTFATPPFQEKLKEWMNTELPPADIARAYQQAAELWHSGAISEAIAILQPLSQQAWGEAATRTLEQYKKVADDFTGLQTLKSDKGYGERLFAFRNSLDPVEDTFFLKAIETDFQTQKKKALSNAEESFKLARQLWNEYQENGGIAGLLRLETAVSKTFRQQAQRLSDACTYVATSTHSYDALRLNYPSEWKTVNDQIRSEIKLQRQSLNDLSMVLAPPLLKTKLDLLAGSQGCNQ